MFKKILRKYGFTKKLYYLDFQVQLGLSLIADSHRAFYLEKKKKKKKKKKSKMK